MLRVVVKTRNSFYELGLIYLLENCLKKENEVGIIRTDENAVVKNVNVIFKDHMVFVNFFKNEYAISDNTNNNNPVVTLNIPFNSSKLDIYSIVYTIGKIFNVAKLKYNKMIKINVFKCLGLKNHSQLSITEVKVVELTVEGNDIVEISRILGRSEKTILTHRRNAIRKLGILNRLEFYNYISYIRGCSNKETIFICI
ncbi:putative luxR-family regulatory protein [Yersinia aldovae]|uniref:LuxR-family regulatory protein n=1 Tax=Yersinia aldovae TaxID=29483 RepID=A0A0T9UDH8_YERAL|nr:helix-turn-helix transcriptional regulator [Yersinia aldovae]CNL34466.1 putative luxR-family regulatory protein [Yersinia aldovae]CNL38233.1 putative luxR-family regulatory protein [Yersinia aldovae]